MLQRTIRKATDCTGIGLHSGKEVRLVLKPAAPDTGILFAVATGAGRRFLTPRPEAVSSTALATTLAEGDVAVSTVEHLLAAIRGLEIDNLLIEVDGAELPILDGSAASYVYLFREAGLREQDAPRSYYRLKKPVTFRRDGKHVKARPADGFHVEYRIDFPHPVIGRQRMRFDLSAESFVRRVAKARTFGFLRDVEKLRAAGLALGGSLDNAVVLDEFDVLNDDGLRYKDEFVRHKMLDFIGDMAVLDKPLLAHFDVFASGHALNNLFARFLADNADEYLEVVTPGEVATAPLPKQAPAAQPARAVHA